MPRLLFFIDLKLLLTHFKHSDGQRHVTRAWRQLGAVARDGTDAFSRGKKDEECDVITEFNNFQIEQTMSIESVVVKVTYQEIKDAYNNRSEVWLLDAAFL